MRQILLERTEMFRNFRFCCIINNFSFLDAFELIYHFAEGGNVFFFLMNVDVAHTNNFSKSARCQRKKCKVDMEEKNMQFVIYFVLGGRLQYK